MGVKYRCDYKDFFENECRIDILKDSYVGDPILIRGVDERACIITRDCGDDPYEPIINTKASISIYQPESLVIDLTELREAQDREFRVKFYLNSVINFDGFLLPDGIQETFQSAPYEVNINATDGLMLLSGIPYTHDNLTGGRCILNYFRQILFTSFNLNLPLPIKWVNSMINEAFPLEEDIFSGSVIWASRGEGFSDYNGNYKSCMYILEGMLRSLQSRIVQSGGKWVVWRVNDVSTGSFMHRETPGTTTGFTITESAIINEIKTIGKGVTYDYNFVEEDAILTTLPALKTVVTTYDQDQRDNILPNGNMDIINFTFNTPIYWGLGGDASAATFSSESGGLGGNDGYHVEITNDITGGEARFEYVGLDLPIDSDVLYSYVNFGFKFSILNGYTLDVNGFIDWNLTSFKIRFWYLNGTDTYYLNENGFWTTTLGDISITVPNLKPSDVAQIDFNAKQNIILPLPNPSPIPRSNNPSIYISFIIPPGRKILLDDVYINTENNSDVYEATYPTTSNTGKEEYTLNISSSHNGFYVSNFMTSFSNSGGEKFFSDDKVSDVTLTEMNSHAILRNRYKPNTVFEGSIYSSQYSYDELYNIQTLTDKNFLPLRSSWNTETNRINLSMVEVRNDGLGINMAHYGSNNKPKLSN